MSPFFITLLRVVGVLAILFLIVVILLPVFFRAREGEGHPDCASNMKILGLGLVQYQQDNDERMPNTENGSADSSWRAVISPYLKDPKRFHCPDRDSGDRLTNPTGADGYAPNYAANDDTQGALAGPGARPVAIADVPEPKNLIVLMETAFNSDPGYNIDNAAQFGPSTRKFWAGHQGLSNYLLFDGHVKAMAPLSTCQIFRPDTVAVNYWYRDDKLPLSANGMAVLQDAQRRFAP